MKQIYGIGIDQGYGNIKTIYHIFCSGVIQKESITELSSMTVEYEGKFYEIGFTHRGTKWTKCEMEIAKVHLYEQYKAREISREDYLARMERGRARMAELEQTRSKSQAEFSALDTFDKDRLKMLIDKVIVYGEDVIEIVWKVRNSFNIEVSV